jgi:hypothetical protein
MHGTFFGLLPRSGGRAIISVFASDVPRIPQRKVKRDLIPAGPRRALGKWRFDRLIGIFGYPALEFYRRMGRAAM